LILLDTSGMLAWLDRRQRHHERAAAAMAAAEPPFLLSPFVLAELDYLLATRVGAEAQNALLEEVERGAYRLAAFSAADVALARQHLRRYSDLDLGLADASILVLADRHLTWDVLTLDQRHFRAVPGPKGRPFRLLPDDA
jgi:predicted nucleic acid-binding protein